MKLIIAITTLGLGLGTTLIACGGDGPPAGARTPETQPAEKSPPSPPVHGAKRTVRVYGEDGTLAEPMITPPLRRSDDAWRERLDSMQYRVLREAGTERAFTGTLLENKKDGVYTCAGCRLPLFASNTKFKSGTGWPSFYQPLARENVAEHVDEAYGMVRTEVVCNRCDGHLGHVFNDGPAPTGLRYCINSVSLAFTPTEKIATLAEPTIMNDSSRPGSSAQAVFAGGCFWCVEAVFEELDGVTDAISGYAGGDEETANYSAVCSGRTRHAEAVQILYDPAKISYIDLLRVHFATHDPTQLNRQGNDVGPQYRSTIFYANAEEKTYAQAFIDDLESQKVYRGAIVTTLEPLETFYPAEKYHQNYVCDNPNQGYVRAIALPKVDKVRKLFKDQLKKKDSE